MLDELMAAPSPRQLLWEKYGVRDRTPLVASLREELMEWYRTSDGTYTVSSENPYPYSKLIFELGEDVDGGC